MNAPAPDNDTDLAPCRDLLGRPLHDLRLSVIDACNFRCSYCMPLEHFPDHYQFLRQDEWLTFDEMVRLVTLMQPLGVRKIRLTGGEPLLRKNLPELVQRLNSLPFELDLSLTTNGTRLEQLAAPLREAGLHRLNVSLDALDPEVLSKLNGRAANPAKTIAAIDAATTAGFASIKVNMVVVRGVNDCQILPMVEHFRGSGHILRFIEYMDVGTLNHWRPEQVVPASEMLSIIASRYPLRPVDPLYYGEVASRHEFLDGSGEIGLITSVSQPFCATCTRSRLTADGRLYTCLFGASGIDLLGPMRDGATDHEISHLLTHTWRQRQDRYSELRAEADQPDQQRVEMYHVGG